jgi:hypothetical protein
MAKYRAGDIIYFDAETHAKSRSFFKRESVGHKLLILSVKCLIHKKYTSYDCTVMNLNTGATEKVTLTSNDPYINKEQ